VIILGSLMVGPSHGYLIAKIMQNITGPYGKISPGRLYPLLTKLEEVGLIVAEPVSEQQGNRQSQRYQVPSRRYHISEAGRKQFHRLMMDTNSYLGDYQKVFVQKVARFSFLQPVERLHLIEHYIGYCQSLVSYGTARAKELANEERNTQDVVSMTSAQLEDLLTAMQHTIHHWQQELFWAEGLREQMKANTDASATQAGEVIS
jgi:DNA-binding PadR family transcriptional regulator